MKPLLGGRGRPAASTGPLLSVRNKPRLSCVAGLALLMILLVGSGIRAGAVSAETGAPDANAAFFDRTGKLTRIPFPNLADLRASVDGIARGNDPSKFWREVVATGQMPLAFGDTAVFLYRGNATSVDWIGDFTFWNSGQPLTGKRIGPTNIWTAQRKLQRDARLDYQIRVDGRQRNDPLNPMTQQSTYGTRSVVTMPDYIYPSATFARKDAPKGALGEPVSLESKHLGYTKRVQVYTPTGYTNLKDLPVLYVTDGQEFIDPAMGALPIVLDNLIAEGKLRPIIAVFIDPRTVTGENLRGPEFLTNPRFQAFITQELIPWVDDHYRTRPSREARGLLGISLGGLHATYTATLQSDWFGSYGLLSPYFAAKPSVLEKFKRTAPRSIKMFVSQGSFDIDIENTRRLTEFLRSNGRPFKYVESNDGHSWGNWRGVLDDMLLYFWGAETP